MSGHKGLERVEQGNWGTVAYIDAGCSKVILYDDDEPVVCDEECEIDECDICEEEAIIYEDIQSMYRGSCYLRVSIDHLYSLPNYIDGWICTDFADEFVYAVMIEPLLDCNRIKVGRTTRLQSRIKAFRTSSPYALLVGLWPGGKHEEERALGCLRSWRIGTSEVFDTPNFAEAIRKINEELRG